MTSDTKKVRVFVAGHNGMAGSAICRQLNQNESTVLVTRSRSELNLSNNDDVNQFFRNENIDVVYLAAAKVGGIHANSTYPAEFLYENLQIQNNIIHGAHTHGVQQLMFLGSSCIYPKLAEQPMKESALLTGELEPTNEPYAIAKIAGIKMCEAYSKQYGRDYRAVMPTNLYGTGDNFHPENSHVIPGLMVRLKKCVEEGTKEFVVWGSGRPMREFLHVDDMATACVHICNLAREEYDELTQEHLSHINVGTGKDHSIYHIANLLKEISGFEGELIFDSSKPDGAPRKLLDISLLESTGWNPEYNIEEGLKATWDWFIKQQQVRHA